LYITLKYLREYRAMDSIAAEYGACKGAVCLAIQWVEDALVKDGAFALPGKKVFKRKSGSIQYILKILEFAANCGKFRGTCSRTGRFPEQV
jgi:hypothetical protein